MKLFLLFLIFQYISTKLLSVIEINRHGARTSFYYPSITDSLFDSGKKQLTVNGYRQQQLLGEFARNKYMKELNFLSKEFNRNQMEIYSSQTERTIFSVIAYLSSLYPEYKIKMNYNDSSEIKVDDSVPLAFTQLKIKEIPIEVIPRKNDSLFHAAECHYQGKVLIDKDDCYNDNNTIYSVSKDDLKKTCHELKFFLNIKEEDDVYDVSDNKKIRILGDFLFSYNYHFRNKLRAKRISEEAIMNIRKDKINKWYWNRITESKFLKIAASEMLDKIFENFKNAKESHENENDEYVKFVLFSGHDTNIVNILSALLKKEYLKELIFKALEDEKIFNFLIPPYASNLFFELHFDEDSQKYFVEIIYNGEHINKGIREVEDKNILQNKIDFKDFSNLMDKIIDKEYTKLMC